MCVLGWDHRMLAAPRRHIPLSSLPEPLLPCPVHRWRALLCRFPSRCLVLAVKRKLARPPRLSRAMFRPVFLASPAVEDAAHESGDVSGGAGVRTGGGAVLGVVPARS